VHDHAAEPSTPAARAHPGAKMCRLMNPSGSTPDSRLAPARSERVVIVMPAYNAAKTLEDTFRAIPAGYFDEIVVVDDHSRDDTAELARSLNLKAIRHP